MSEAWKLAQENLKRAQKSQKIHYDKSVPERKVKQGESLFTCPQQKGEKLTSSHDHSTDLTE